MKSKHIIFTVILLAVSAAAIIFLVVRGQNNRANSNVFQAIPEDAEGVAVINLEAFMELFFMNIGDVWEMREEFKGNTQTEKISEEMRLSGVNLSRKIAVYGTGDRFNLLVPISDAEKFQEYLSRVDEDAKLTQIAESQYYSGELGGFVAFNENLCYVTQCEQDQTDEAIASWNSILNADKKKPMDEHIQSLANSDQHFSFFIKEDEMAQRSPYFNHSPSSRVSLVFEEGKIRINSTLFTENAQVKNPLISGTRSLEKGEYMDVHLSVDPNASWDYWLNNKGKKTLVDMLSFAGVSEEFSETWGGVFNFSIDGVDTFSQESISYTYDENFNKVEQKTYKDVKRIKYTLCHNGKENNLNFKGAELLGLAEGKHHSMNGMHYISSGEPMSLASSEDEHAISITLRPKNMIDLALEQGMFLANMAVPYADLVTTIRLESKPKGQIIESELTLETADPDKNALLFLLGEFQRLK